MAPIFFRSIKKLKIRRLGDPLNIASLFHILEQIIMSLLILPLEIIFHIVGSYGSLKDVANYRTTCIVIRIEQISLKINGLFKNHY